jgi:hypothetical protein
MKIILTHAESITKLQSHLECEDVTIEYPANVDKPNFPILGAFRLVKRMDGYKTHNKIPAIKAVRQFAWDNGFTMGLADAKYFVEEI